MSDEQATGSEQQPAQEQGDQSLAQPVADPAAPPSATEAEAQSAEPSVETGSATAEDNEQTPAAVPAPEAEPEPPAAPEAASGEEPAETSASAPAEGFDPDKNVFVKQFNLASGAPLHELSADEITEHPQTAGLPDAAARAALDLGYKPTGPAQLVHAEPDGAKSALSFAVPVEPRPGPTASFAPEPFQERPREDGPESAPPGE